MLFGRIDPGFYLPGTEESYLARADSSAAL